jgi:cell division protein ZapA
MAQINVTINSRPYTVACGDGEEEHLLKLAQFVDERVTALAREVGQVGDARLLLMSSLLIADDFMELKERVAALEAEAAQARQALSKVEANASSAEARAAAFIDRAAARMEALANRLAAQ